MPPTPETPSTPWRHGFFKAQLAQLSFGQTYEDSAIELQAFGPRSRVFCIAGAEYTARALAAAGHHVTAVDISPVQLSYAQSRAAGGPLRRGIAERLLALGRNLAKFAGWSRGKVTDFLNMSDPAEQLEYWDRRLDTHAWRVAVDTLLAPRLLSICYASPFIESLPQDFGLRLRRRLRRTWARHSNRSNPYAASLLLGRPPAEPNAPESQIQFVCADAADFLESCPPAAFDGFSLSNIGDGVSPQYLRASGSRSIAPPHRTPSLSLVPSRNPARTLAQTGPNWTAPYSGALSRSVAPQKFAPEANHVTPAETASDPSISVLSSFVGVDLCFSTGNPPAIAPSRLGARYLSRTRISSSRFSAD